MTDEAREWKTALGLALRANGGLRALLEARSAKKPPKVWLDIMVVMPNRRGDALNLLDICADGCQDALGVDDRNFAIWRLDWAVDKKRPEIKVRVGV